MQDVFGFLVAPFCIEDLGSWTRFGICGPYSGSADSQPLNHQRSPKMLIITGGKWGGDWGEGLERRYMRTPSTCCIIICKPKIT